MADRKGVLSEGTDSERRAFLTTSVATALAFVAVSLEPSIVAQALVMRRKRWNEPARTLEAWDYARRADSALARGDNDLAVELVTQAYLAYDLYSC
jgi:hypothetical protein